MNNRITKNLFTMDKTLTFVKTTFLKTTLTFNISGSKNQN